MKRMIWILCLTSAAQFARAELEPYGKSGKFGGYPDAKQQYLAQKNFEKGPPPSYAKFTLTKTCFPTYNDVTWPSSKNGSPFPGSCGTCIRTYDGVKGAPKYRFTQTASDCACPSGAQCIVTNYAGKDLSVPSAGADDYCYEAFPGPFAVGLYSPRAYCWVPREFSIGAAPANQGGSPHEGGHPKHLDDVPAHYLNLPRPPGQTIGGK